MRKRRSIPQRTEVALGRRRAWAATVDLASMSDPVLIREDGTYLYTLPSVVDDVELASRISSAATTT